jgi:Uma2 family endonuclease
MSQPPPKPIATPPNSEPASDVARLFPDQGHWSEEEYLAYVGNRLVEFSHGDIEVLPMPTTAHQRLVAFLYGCLLSFLGTRQLGEVLFAPLRIRLWAGKYREPDIVVMLREHAARLADDAWDGADLVIEILSPDNRGHDLQTKRREYAQAGIPEYWIVDPEEGRILVLTLEGSSYIEHGAFARGEQAASRLLPGFGVDVAAVFDAARLRA